MIEFDINGAHARFDGDPQMPLLWYLRDHAGLTGTKFGCGGGYCGACSVLVDGRVRRSCLLRMRATAARTVEARYRVPFVSHAPLEPQNAFVHVESERARVIAPMQSPAGAQRMVHALTGLPRPAIEVEMTRSGSGFGRRLSNDFVDEAALISKTTGKPIKLLWAREDDLQHDFFRPFGHHHMIATLDDTGRVSG